MGLGHSGTVTQWERDTAGLGHSGTVTQWERDTAVKERSGNGTQREWETVGTGHSGNGTQWERDTAGGNGTQRTGHRRTDASIDVSLLHAIAAMYLTFIDS